MERAIIKLPMKRKITGSEKGARAVLISARPKRTQRITPRRAVMGRGTGSPIHQTTTQRTMAASLWAGGEREGKGNKRIIRKIKGPSPKAIRWRQKSKREKLLSFIAIEWYFYWFF